MEKKKIATNIPRRNDNVNNDRRSIDIFTGRYVKNEIYGRAVYSRRDFLGFFSPQISGQRKLVKKSKKKKSVLRKTYPNA